MPAKTKTAGPPPLVFMSLGLAEGLKICISNKFPGAVVAVTTWTQLQNQSSRDFYVFELIQI